MAASNVLLYLSLVFASAWLAVLGAALSPLLWKSAVLSRRHLALLLSVLLLLTAPYFVPLDHWIEVLQSRFVSVALAPSFVFRPSLLPILALLPTRSRRVSAACAANVGIAVATAVLVQWLSGGRSDLQTVGFVFFASFVAVEAVNVWFFWRTPDHVVSRRPFGLLMVVAAIVIAFWVPPVTPQRASVAMWWPESPRLEFATVSQGYGWNNIGTIGELPLLLEQSGYAVTRPSRLDAIDTTLLILTVPFRPMTASEVTEIRRFVSAGGRLLLIGEHTNMEGVRDNFNAVLEGTGVALQFDTTNALFGDGTLALQGPYVSRNPYLTHNRGASLAITRFGPMPLLVGSWWHSDLGDRLAPERAYLSDYRLSPGDAVGNLVLAARTTLGQGRIVVWGDGSPFLNQNIVYNSRYILDTVNGLTGEPRGRWISPLVAVFLLTVWAMTRRPEIIGLAAVIGLSTPMIGVREAPLPQPLAVVSDAESNGFDRDAFSGRSVTGLGVWLTRAGYVPWLGDWESLPRPPRLLFILNPNLAITRGYVEGLRRVAESGTTVVIAGGGDNESFRRLAGEFGSAPVGAPVGSITGEEFTTYSAWRLQSSTGAALKAGDIPVGVTLNIGRGKVVIFADSGFFLSKNLETETEYDLRNQRFLGTLLGSP